MILPFKTALDAKMNEVLGNVDSELIKGKPSSSLTNFVADAVSEGYQNISGKKLDIVMMNYGGVRVNSLGAGDITVGEVYEIMPFENYLIVIDADGSTMKQLFDKAAHSGGWPMSANSSYSIKDSTATDIVINGKVFDINNNYTIGLPDYIANGGDDCKFLKSLSREDTGLLIRDILIQEIKQLKSIKANNEQRVKIIK
jgi:2',3'-cyclic-nucleotide 2'-phosphodiesterase (5'-nucleotidase family)